MAHEIQAMDHAINQKPEVIHHENPMYYKKGQISDDEYFAEHGVNWDLHKDKDYLSDKLKNQYIRAKLDPHGFQQELQRNNTELAAILSEHLNNAMQIDSRLKRIENDTGKSAQVQQFISQFGGVSYQQPAYQQPVQQQYYQQPQQIISTGSATMDNLRLGTNPQQMVPNFPPPQNQYQYQQPNNFPMNQMPQQGFHANQLISNRSRLRDKIDRMSDNNSQNVNKNKQNSHVTKNIYKRAKKTVPKPNM